MMYIDLDELDELDSKIRWFSYNKGNLFSFFDDDHFNFTRHKSKDAEKISKEKFSYDSSKYEGKNTKERIITLVKELRLGFVPEKVFILTNLRNLGYVFNPVSFYYCFDKEGKFRAMFSEVNNTYGQHKTYYVKINDPSAKIFKDKQRKNFYISPFIDYDTDLQWTFNVPKENLSMIIDSRKEDKSVLQAVLSGRREELTSSRLFFLNFRYPLMTFMVIIMIHYQALKLWLKRIRFRDNKKTNKEIVAAISKK